MAELVLGPALDRLKDLAYAAYQNKPPLRREDYSKGARGWLINTGPSGQDINAAWRIIEEYTDKEHFRIELMRYFLQVYYGLISPSVIAILKECGGDGADG